MSIDESEDVMPQTCLPILVRSWALQCLCTGLTIQLMLCSRWWICRMNSVRSQWKGIRTSSVIEIHQNSFIILVDTVLVNPIRVQHPQISTCGWGTRYHLIPSYWKTKPTWSRRCPGVAVVCWKVPGWLQNVIRKRSIWSDGLQVPLPQTSLMLPKTCQYWCVRLSYPNKVLVSRGFQGGWSKAEWQASYHTHLMPVIQTGRY